ncbi:hypothetical protein [Frisingicoccus sp.]|uniref:hypothetical protein n=1 Tax=Frisingicoccus sp. TaxID=1918627 RepID=UPI0025C67C3B|nr:hypothetical protein [Frisingicoccus sp.]
MKKGEFLDIIHVKRGLIIGGEDREGIKKGIDTKEADFDIDRVGDFSGAVIFNDIEGKRYFFLSCPK